MTEPRSTAPKASTDAWFEELPVLEGWIMSSEAAERLQISVQHFNRLLHRGRFTARRVGNRRSIVVSETEILDYQLQDTTQPDS